MSLHYQFRLPARDVAFRVGVNAREEEAAGSIAAEVGDILASLGGEARVTQSGADIVVTWTPEPPDADGLDIAVAALQERRYPEGILVLRLLHSAAPEDAIVLYNLGMALSDIGELDEAIAALEMAASLDAANTNVQVAFAVALARRGDVERATSALQAAVDADPDNPWAHRNLGACLLQAGDHEGARAQFLLAVELAPSDQQSRLGLAQALESLDDTERADAAYRATLELDEYSPGAEIAREGLTRLAERAFHARSPEALRPDAVMYLVDALRRFRDMDRQSVERVAFEIAMLGRSGLDVSDAQRTYTLASLDGERTGLNLVCLLYAGMKMIAPDEDVGLDLSNEYAAALSLMDQPAAE